MNILITGVHGFVGSNLVKYLAKENTIYGLDIVQPQKDGVMCTFSWDALDVENGLPEIDAIIHLAGMAHDTRNKSAADVYFKVNTGLTQKIFDWYMASPTAKKFVFFSTVKSAADRVKGEFLTEECVPTPVGPYGESKIKAEDYIIKKFAPKALKRPFHNFDDSDSIVSEYTFSGFDFNTITDMYLSISLDSMKNARKKVLLMRPLIEACFFQLSSRDKFDPENIGSMYAKTTRANKNDAEKYGICKKLQEIYDSSKKYHHGADDGSLLGISWINPNEIEYYDQVLNEIITRIRARCTIRAMIA